MNLTVCPLRLFGPGQLANWFRQINLLLRFKLLTKGRFEIRRREWANRLPGAEFFSSRRFSFGRFPVRESTGKFVFLESSPGIKKRLVLRVECVQCFAGSFRVRIPVVILKSCLSKRRCKAVIIVIAERIKLVIVTAGTANGQPEHRCSQCGNDIVKLFVPAAFTFLLSLL